MAWSIEAERNGVNGCRRYTPPWAAQMSVASLARTAGVTGLASNNRWSIVSTSLVLALHEHDVHESLPDVLADQLAVLVQGAEAAFLGMVLRTAARSGDAVRHVGVFRIGEDEVRAGRIGENPGELLVQ